MVGFERAYCPRRIDQRTNTKNLHKSLYKRTREELRLQIAAVEVDIGNLPDSTFVLERSELVTQRNKLENSLDVLESSRLKHEAARFGIDLVGAVGPWHSDANRRNEWLKKPERIAASRVIREARFAWWKKWMDLLSPIVSVVVSVLAFVLAVLALYLEVTGRIATH